MAKRILIAIILIISFAFFIAVRVPAQTIRPLAGSKNNQTGKQEKQDKRTYLLRTRESHKRQQAEGRKQKAGRIIISIPAHN